MRGSAHTCAQCLKMRWAGERKGLSRATIRRAIRLFGNGLQSQDFVKHALALHQAELTGAQLPHAMLSACASPTAHGSEKHASLVAFKHACRQSRPSAGRRATMRGLPMSPKGASGYEGSGLDQTTESDSEDSGTLQFDSANPLDAFAGTVLAAALGEQHPDLSPSAPQRLGVQLQLPTGQRSMMLPHSSTPEHMTAGQQHLQPSAASMHADHTLLKHKRALPTGCAAASEVSPLHP